MKPTLLKTTLKALKKVNRTTCIEGAPGGGKTTIIHEVAKELDVHYIERHMPTSMVEDFGIPDVLGSVAEESGVKSFNYVMPDWFPAKGSRYDDGRGGILCFDDRNQAGADLQKVMANICQARNLHGIEIADDWMIVSTGNRATDRAGAQRVLSHLRNRETVLELETNLNDSTSWMAANGVKGEVISFLRFKSNLLHDFDPQRDANPTPRSWVEGVSDVLGVIPGEAEFEAFKGAVGEGAAAEFRAFVKIWRELPNVDNVLMHPDTHEIPTDPAVLYALSGSIAERAEEGNFSRVCTFFEREEMPAEFSVLAISLATRRNPKLAQTEALANWAVKHQDVLF